MVMNPSSEDAGTARRPSRATRQSPPAKPVSPGHAAASEAMPESIHTVITTPQTSEEAPRENRQSPMDSEEYYRILTQTSPDGILTIDAKGTLTYVNPALEKMFDIPSSISVGTHFRNYVARASQRKAEELFLNAMQGRTVRDIEIEVVHHDQHIFPIEIAVSPILKSGQFYGVECVIRDITDRKRAQEALRRSEERYHRLFEDDLTGDFVSTPDGRIVLCNSAFARIFGFSSADEAPGTNLLELYTDASEQDSLVETLRQQGKIERLEAWRKRRDGGLIYVVENLVGNFNDQGELYEIRGYVFDDTDRKQAEEALRESEAKFRQLFDSLPLGAILIDPQDYTFKMFNDAAARNLGYSPEEFSRLSIRSVEAVHDESQIRANFTRFLAGERLTFETQHLTKSGQRRDVWVTASRIDIGGRPLVLAMSVDITVQKETERQLRELTATLESRVAERTEELDRKAKQLQKLTLDMSETEDRERRRLAEILHDDLQQVLAAAKFHLGLLRRQAWRDSSLQAIGAEIDQMLKDAIEKSRSLSHELSPAVLHHGDFVEILEWLARQVRVKHGLVVHVRADGQVSAQSDTLKAVLYKAAQELLFNTIKHAQVKEAGIRVRRMGQCVCLSVSDRGRGFDPQDLGHAAGFGLLSIRERIDLLGGRMTIRSEKGKGSTFYIAVPDDERSEPEGGLELEPTVTRGEPTASPASR